MIEKLLSYAKTENLDLEIFAITNDEITIEYTNDLLTSYKLQNIKSYNLKAIIDGASVTAKVLDISNPEEVIKSLRYARTLTDELDEDTLTETGNLENTERKDVSVNPAVIKDNIENFNAEIIKNYPDVRKIFTSYNFEKDFYEIYNTNGTKLIDTNYHAYYMADIVINGSAEKSIACDKYVMAKEPDFTLFKCKVIETIESALNKVHHQSVITDKYKIILDNKCAHDLLSSFALDFHALNISKKQSVFTDKLNEKIFSDKITIVEDPTNKELIGTRLFDGEGTKTYYKKIVEDGIFKTILYNKKYAKKDNTISTGNSYGVKNMYILPGVKSKDELFNLVDKGIYIDDLMGLHSGINHLTGDISIQCEGFLIENGKKTTGLKQIVLSTNIFELLGGVLEVGSDLEFFGSDGGSPSLLIDNITIAGKEV